MKKMFSLLFSRVVLVAGSMVLQAMILLVMLVKFQEYFAYFYGICTLLSLVIALYVINSKINPGYKIAWLVPLLLFPIFGGLFYLIFGGRRLSRREQRKMSAIGRQVIAQMGKDGDTLETMKEESMDAYLQSRYIERYAYSGVCRNTYSEYLPLGEVKFQRLIEELEKARHYIFLEYFIIQEGIMWNTILEILERKVAQGVDVRVIYDDMGCLTTLPKNYHQQLEEKGIQCCVFNPFVPVLSSRFNNRDHRKIAVIDGYVGFTGGINLADEYINAYPKHGHWKDTAILLRGDAVWNLTVMFLSMWNYLRHTDENFDLYRPHVHQPVAEATDGYVQPFSDAPLDMEAVGETVYMNILSRAKRYVYITTPYLIVDNEMVTALSHAAKQGVDVRIITPHIGDKWFVHASTRAYYEMLVENGVKIYEYTPGFIHAKTFVCDDLYATVGTINMDYRSLYLHFECAAWLYHTRSVLQVRDDFLKTQDVSQPITLEWCRQCPWYVRLVRALLRLFAPLM